MDTKMEYYSTDLEDSVKKEEFCEKLEEDLPWYDEDSSCLSMQSKKIIKKRKKYQKIDNEVRLKIIEEVQKNGKLLKNAAEKYNVNYSSAKSIFHVYRKEGRILKKPFKGRASKTILHLNNPIVFVNVTPQNILPSASTNEDQKSYSQVWQQLPSMGAMTLKGQSNTDSSPQPLVSILHPSSAALLQKICSGSNTAANTHIGTRSALPMSASNMCFAAVAAAQERMKNTAAAAAMIDRRWEQLVKVNQNVPPRINSQLLLQNYTASQHLVDKKSLLLGLDIPPSPVSDTLKKATLLNNWAQSQWKAASSM